MNEKKYELWFLGDMVGEPLPKNRDSLNALLKEAHQMLTDAAAVGDTFKMGLFALLNAGSSASESKTVITCDKAAARRLACDTAVTTDSPATNIGSRSLQDSRVCGGGGPRVCSGGGSPGCSATLNGLDLRRGPLLLPKRIAPLPRLQLGSSEVHSLAD